MDQDPSLRDLMRASIDLSDAVSVAETIENDAPTTENGAETIENSAEKRLNSTRSARAP